MLSRQACAASEGMIDVRVADKLVDNTPVGRLRAFYEWLTGAASTPPSSMLATLGLARS